MSVLLMLPNFIFMFADFNSQRLLKIDAFGSNQRYFIFQKPPAVPV